MFLSDDPLVIIINNRRLTVSRAPVNKNLQPRAESGRGLCSQEDLVLKTIGLIPAIPSGSALPPPLTSHSFAHRRRHTRTRTALDGKKGKDRLVLVKPSSLEVRSTALPTTATTGPSPLLLLRHQLHSQAVRCWYNRPQFQSKRAVLACPLFSIIRSAFEPTGTGASHAKFVLGSGASEVKGPLAWPDFPRR